MFGRRGFGLLLAGAVGVPYAITQTSEALSARGGLAGLASSFQAEEEPSVQAALGSGAAEVTPIHQAFRFDVSTAWVLGHWPRVSASLSDLSLQGYRVPLVTGTSETDVAGSLTYYFNPRQSVQRITFFGTSGDTRNLVAWLTGQHAFAREITADPALAVYRSRKFGRPTSELRIKPAQVVDAAAPHARFEIALVMERP